MGLDPYEIDERLNDAAYLQNHAMVTTGNFVHSSNGGYDNMVADGLRDWLDPQQAAGRS